MPLRHDDHRICEEADGDRRKPGCHVDDEADGPREASADVCQEEGGEDSYGKRHQRRHAVDDQ